MPPPRAAFPVALAFAALLAPGALAQGVTANLAVSVTDPGEDLVPGRPTTLAVLVRYSFGPGGFSDQPVTVTLEVAAKPAWSEAAIEDPVLVFPINATDVGGAAYEKTTFVNLTVAPLAPAREKGDFVVTASSSARGNLPAKTAESPRIGLTVKFTGALNVTGPASVLLRGGREEVVTFVVRNDANGETDVALAVRTAPEESIVTPPASIALGVEESREVPVRIRVPWTRSVTGLLELEARSVRAGDDAEPFVATVEVQGTSVVPGPAGLAAVLAVGAAVASRKRSR